MPRYAKQLDNFSCGPIAIYNVGKWLGYPGNWKHMKNIMIEDTKYHKKKGLKQFDFDRSLRQWHQDKVSITYNMGVKIGQIFDYVWHEDCAMIFNYFWRYKKKWGRHYVFIDWADDKHISIVNWHDAKENLTRKQFRKYFMRYRDNIGWYLDKGIK